jgi:uncharacterized protein YbjT (DUF2867 family)
MSDMGLVANVIGASGLVGKELVEQLLNYQEFEKVRIFVRRNTGILNSKLEEHIIDFEKPETWKSYLHGDMLFSTLGTTIKTAKTKDKQYRVDFTYQFQFAKAAAENGVPCYILVSSMGADSRSKVFYSRIKGELEDAVALLKFRRLLIFRPSILDGDRKEKRRGEKIGLVISRFITYFILKSYRPTPVGALVNKMIRSSLDPIDGCHIVEASRIYTSEY